MENENLKPVEKLTPFTKMIMTIGTLPSSFYASMSYYESMVWLYEYLKNTVIPTVNNNGEAVEELQSAFLDLKEWTETYTEETIPEEISNKLDEMATDGTLQTILDEIIKYKGLLSFNNIEEMQESTNIVDGSFLKTFGFYSVNDGGGANYKARIKTTEDVIDNMTLFALNDQTLVAELIIENSMNFKQIGGKGDGTTDETNKLLKFLTLNCNTYEFNKDDTILISGKHNYIIADNSTINGNGATIKHIGCTMDSNVGNDSFMTFSNVNNLTINDLKLNGQCTYMARPLSESDPDFAVYYAIRDKTYQPWHFYECDHLTLNNLYSTRCRTGFFTEYCTNMVINNCSSYQTLADGFFLADSRHAVIKKCSVSNANDDCFSSCGFSTDPDTISYQVQFDDCYGEESVGALLCLAGGSYLSANNCLGVNTKLNPLKLGNLITGNTAGDHIYVNNCKITTDTIQVYGTNSVPLILSGGTGGNPHDIYLDNCEIVYTGALKALNLNGALYNNVSITNTLISGLFLSLSGDNLTLNNCKVLSSRGSAITGNNIFIENCYFKNDNLLSTGYVSNIHFTEVSHLRVTGGRYETTDDFALSISNPAEGSTDIEIDIDGKSWIANTYQQVRVKPVTVNSYGSLTAQNLKPNTLFFISGSSTLIFYTGS